MTIFYVFMSLCLGLSTFLASSNRRIDRQLFLLFSLILVLTVILKPFGSSPDDFNYANLVEACAGRDCITSGEINRDLIWFFLVSLSSVGSGFFIIKLIAVFALLLKLFVIYKLTTNRLYALSIYVFGFFFLHDLTQYRASLAIGFFFLAIYFFTCSRVKMGVVSVFASIGSHIQAAVAICLSVMPGWINIRYVFFGVITILLLLIAIGEYPNINWIIKAFSIFTGQDYDQNSDLGKYIHLVYSNSRMEAGNLSYVVIGTLLALWIAKPGCGAGQFMSERKRALEISFRSMFLGFIFYFVFASIPELQIRLFEFFAVTLVLIFGNCINSPRNLFSLITICGLMAFNHRIFVDFFIT